MREGGRRETERGGEGESEREMGESEIGRERNGEKGARRERERGEAQFIQKVVTLCVCRGRKSVHEYLSVYIEICVIICNINCSR